MQYNEFLDAWDKYMGDYEQTAIDLIGQLKNKQEKEMYEMRARVTEKFYNDLRWNK